MRALSGGLRGLALVLLLLSLSLTASASLPIVRNGGFDDGLSSWKMATGLEDWDPVYDDGMGNAYISMDVASQDYDGPVLTQSLNITDVADKELTVSIDLQTMWGWSDGGAKIDLLYVDTADNVQQIEALTTDGETISGGGIWTTVTRTCLVPSDARKIIGIVLESTSYTYYYADNITLSASGVQVGAVPQVTEVTPESGPYGTTVTITGEDFGSASPTNQVWLGDSADGVNILSWTDTEIQAQVNDPSSGGHVIVRSDFVDSEGDLAYNVTSPYFTIGFLNSNISVVKGNSAQFIVRVDVFNGFSSPSGISFSATDAPAGIVSFEPSVVHGKGGTLMSIDTSTLQPGDYYWTLEAADSGSLPRTIPFTLHVSQVGDLSWIYTADWSQITEMDATQQGRLDLTCEAMDNDGMYLDYASVAITSSDPSIVLPYCDSYGYWNYYACANGTAVLTATACDGTVAQLTVNVDFPTENSTISASCTPSVISNNGTDVLNFAATTQIPYTNLTFYGDISTFNADWGVDGNSFTCQATATEGSDPGTFMFGMGESYSYPFLPALFTVINDPSMGQISGQAYLLEGGMKYETTSSGTLEFYDLSGSMLFDRYVSASYDSAKPFTVSYIEPGSYKLRFVPDGGGMPQYMSTMSSQAPNGYGPQWYSNADDFDSAAEVIVNAGQTVQDVFFFLRAAPLEVLETYPEDGATGFPLDESVYVEFSKWLNEDTVSELTCSLTDDQGNQVPGYIYADGTTIYFEPDDLLTAGMTYTATITTGVKSEDGVSLDEDYTFSFTTMSNRMTDLKSLEDGTEVVLMGKNLYYVDDSGYMGYIEEPDRSCGIRVEGLNYAYQDDIIDYLYGEMATTEYGERYIDLYDAWVYDRADTRPFGANNKALQTDLITGLKVRVWGIVKSVDFETPSYVLCDGSDPDGITVYGDCPVKPGEPFAVNGAAGWEDTRVIYALPDYMPQ